MAWLSEYPATMRLARLTFALLLAVGLPAQAANPRAQSLQIEIWPEYDQPRALVILKAELAADAALPAMVTLRIPASSGGPSAVAYADPSGKLLNLAYDRESAENFVTLRLQLPQRSFHVEFYDALDSGKAQREYRYTWPGDLAVEKLAVLVKEPAKASNLAVQPKLEGSGQSPDGLMHRAAQLGAFKAGQSLPISISYTKTDPRASTEILGAADPGAAPAPRSGSGAPPWPLYLIGAGVLGLLVAGSALLLSRRRAAPAAAGHCPKCGKAANAGDRFCRHCGAAQG